MSSFIVFEGGEGSGKTSALAALAHHLRSRGESVVTTREPGGTPVAEAIREVLLNDSAHMTPRCEALLFAAARADHTEVVIRPALGRGEWVLCDRYVDSSLAYQGAGRALSGADIRELSQWATNRLTPDLTIVLDVDPVLGLSRARDGNRMEAQALTFHQDVRACFLELAAADPQGHVVIDARAPLADVAQAVCEAADRLGSTG